VSDNTHVVKGLVQTAYLRQSAHRFSGAVKRRVTDAHIRVADRRVVHVIAVCGRVMVVDLLLREGGTTAHRSGQMRVVLVRARVQRIVIGRLFGWGWLGSAVRPQVKVSQGEAKRKRVGGGRRTETDG
jgi:hypothetical protein